MRAVQTFAKRILRGSKINPTISQAKPLFANRTAQRNTTSVLKHRSNHIIVATGFAGFASLAFFGRSSSGHEKALRNALSLIESGKAEEALKILSSLSEDGDVLEVRVAALQSLNRNGEAAQILEDYLAKNPNIDAETKKSLMARLADCHVKCNQFIEAYNVLNELYDMDKKNTTVIFDLIYVCRKLGYSYMPFAFILAICAVKLEPSATAWNYLGSILSDRGDVSGAAKCYSEGLALEPNSEMIKYNYAKVMISQNKLKEAEEHLLDLTQDIKMGPLDAAVQDLLFIYFYENRMEEAKKLALRLSAKCPEDPLAWTFLARSYLSSDVDMAMKYFQKALTLDSNDVHANDGMASCLFLKGQHKDLVQYAQRAANHSGSLLANVCMYDEAHAYVDSVSKILGETNFCSAKRTICAGQMDYPKEFEYFLRQLKAEGDLANYYFQQNEFEKALEAAEGQSILVKAPILINMGRHKEAFELLKEHCKGTLTSYGPLELLMIAMSRDDSMLKEAEELCLQFPTNFPAVMALSEVRRRQGRYQEAINLWKYAHFINQSQALIYLGVYEMRPLAWRQYAQILESMGNVEEAINNYKFVLAINPKDKLAKERLTELQKKFNK